jgi:2-aminobenzoate-CoA ligase
MLETMVQPRSAATAHADTFARDNLPPRELWPEIDLSGVPALAARDRINAAADLLDARVAAGGGERTALVFPGGRWTYAELLATANRIAGVLRDELGLVPGNRVLLRGFNSPMMVACWFAVLKAGGIVVATMPLLRARELITLAAKAQIRFALCDARLMEEMETAAAASPSLERVVAFGGGGEGALETLMEGRSEAFDNVDTAADDVALLAFTSGTTGQPKGTMHVHRDLLAVCETFSAHVLRPEPDDLFCGSPPLAFTYGLGGLVLFPFHAGASVLLLEQAAPPQLIAGMRDFRATVVFTAPTAYRAMASLVKDYDLSPLRKCVSAGETLPLATFEAWREATGLKIIDGIGSTEMLHIFISAAGDDVRPGSTGRPVAGYSATLLDENGEPVGPGGMGRLAVKGPTGCRYLADASRQRTYVENGWNITGDTYRLDDDGYYRYQARNDDMIISSGYNIAGPEVENALLEHAAVSECAVIGTADIERGQVVTAFVVLREGCAGGDGTVKELQDFVKRQIAPYKYPRRIEFVTELPRTQTGKLQRFRLREGGG